jgi:GNAT superfamily N-acetyltransferase
MRIVDLKREAETGDLIRQYVDLRNSYANLLVTTQVSLTETQEWLVRADIEIRVIVEDGLLTGAVILYLNKDGEVTFFAREKSKGIGSRLLQVIESVAADKDLKSIWAWVLQDNRIAQRAFEKNGYVQEGTVVKELVRGIKYRRTLTPAQAGDI